MGEGSGESGAHAALLRTVFGSRRLRRLQYALIGSLIGRWGYYVALGVYAYQEGGAALVGIAGLLRLGPGALVAPFASAVVDRHRREHVMVTVDLVRALLLALVAGAIVAGLGPAVVLVLVGLSSMVGALFEPARAALVPSLVETPEQLTAVNVVGSAVNSVGFFAGPALGGLLLAATSVEVTFLAVCGALVWSAANIVALGPVGRPSPQTAATPSPSGYADDVREGVRVVTGDPGLMVLLGLFFVEALVNGALTVFLVIVPLDLLDAGEEWVGYLNAAIGIGALAGTVLVTRILAARTLSTGTLVGFALWGSPLALIAGVPTEWVALIALALIGVGDTAVDVSAYTLLQRVVPHNLLGRVFGLLEAVLIVGVSLGALLTPTLVSAFGMEETLLAVAAVLPVMAAVGARRLRALDVRTEVDEERRGLLRGIPIFRPLPLPALDGLALALQPLAVADGRNVFEQGEAGDRFYVIDAGEVDIVQDGRPLQRLGRGDGFGEIALLRDVRRTASAVAAGPVSLMALDRDAFLTAVTGNERAARAADGLIASRMPAPGAATAR